MQVMSFRAPVIIFDNEDEEALKTRFVELCARNPQVSTFEIAEYLFKDLRDPSLRSQQAAIVWARDLDIKERIRQYRLNGEPTPVITREQWLSKIITIAEDTRLDPREKKAALDGLELYGKGNGWVTNSVDKKVEKTDVRKLPVFEFAPYAE